MKYLQEHFEALQVEFKTEVELLAKIEHRNLVKLLGYVDKGNDRLIITEYVPNGTLREHLDGKVVNLNGSNTPTQQKRLFLNFTAACGRFTRKSFGF